MNTEFKCEICGRSFSRKESLTRHVNCTHLKIKNNQFKHNCRICGKDITKQMLQKHLKTDHNLSEQEIFEYRFLYSRTDFSMIPEDILKYYLKKLYLLNRGMKIYEKQFRSFFYLVTKIRQIVISDIDNFFNVVLDWKLKNPNRGNDKFLCQIVFPNEPENQKLLYEKEMLSKNPFTNHGGIYSPFSKKFIGYTGKTDEEIKELVYKAGKYDKVGRNPTQKEYWIKRGFSEEEAKKKVYEHTNRFSLEICIQKYGEEKGYERWKQRQEKWQNTLKSKSLDEINKINHDKVYKNGPKSGIEREFLMSIIPDETYHNKYIKELGVIVDLIFNKKIIEFYGDYWHCNPSERRFIPSFYHPYLKMTAQEKWEFDENRINKLKNVGYDVKIIWEKDYKQNKEEIIKECKKFIGVK